MNECAIWIMSNLNGLAWAALTSVEAACAIFSAQCIAVLSAIAGVSVSAAQAVLVVGVIVVIAVLIQQGYVAWINNNDRACHNRGVFVDQAWGGTTWIDSIC